LRREAVHPIGLVTGRRELAAAVAGAGIGIGVALAWDPAGGTVAGGVLGPLVALLVPAGPAEGATDAGPIAGSVT